MHFAPAAHHDMPARWRRAHNELSPPSSPAVDVVGKDTKPVKIRPQQPITQTAPSRAAKALTPPTTAETKRTTAAVRPATGSVRDEAARDGDRSSSSSPTPAGTTQTNEPLPGTVTPPPTRRVWRAKRPAAAIPPPIRDTPNNPFIEGGPADLGFRGPFGADARIVADARAANRVQRGRTTYVFRGQRITYDDPEYVSGDSDSDGLFGPNGLQPKLLFPACTPQQRSSSSSSSNGRLRTRAAPTTAAARLAASLTAHERHLAATSSGSSRGRVAGATGSTAAQRDENGIDIDTYFGPAEPLQRGASHDRRAGDNPIMHADARQLLRACDDWSSELSEDEGGISSAAAGFGSLERVRMDMDFLVATNELPPASADVAGSIAMTRHSSSRSSTASARSTRSARLIQGAGNKRKAHPLWADRESSSATASGLGGGDEEGGTHDSCQSLGVSRITLSNEERMKRTRLFGPGDSGAERSVEAGPATNHAAMADGA
ncbi:hypothetical protein V8E36_006408 [Tilletia maclaganii]